MNSFHELPIILLSFTLTAMLECSTEYTYWYGVKG